MTFGNLMVARYTTNTTQNVPNITITTIDFEDMDFDPYGWVTVGAAWNFTPKHAGYYFVTCSILWSNFAWTNMAWFGNLRATKNNAINYMFERKQSGVAASKYIMQDGGTLMYLNGSTDFANFRAYQNTGGVITLHNDPSYMHCSIFRV